jgi:hypothetical protein
MKVKKKPDIYGYFADLSERLNEDEISLIDFDELQQKLRELSARQTASDRMAEEHALLRQDCEQRLAGMIKAIAAVDRSRDSYESALAMIEDLPSLSAGDLLRKYRQVAARFRDCFPTTFNGFPTGYHTTLNRSQVRDLK